MCNLLKINKLAIGGGKSLVSLLRAVCPITLLCSIVAAGFSVFACEHPTFDPLDDYDEESITRTDSIIEDSTGINLNITIVAPDWEIYKNLTF